jgi:ATP-binding cassette subfamily C protein
VIAALYKLFTLFNRRERFGAAILLIMMAFGAFLEVLGLAAVPAFVSAVIDPGRLSDLPMVGVLLAPLGAIDNRTLVVWGALALIAIFAVKNGFLILNQYLQLRFITNRRMALASRLMRAYMRARYSFHLAHNNSELLRNVDREVNIVCFQVLGSVLDLSTRLLILAAVLGFLFVAEPWITLFWVGFLGSAAAAGIVVISGRLRRFGVEEQQQRARFIKALYEGFGSLKEARVLNRERYFEHVVADAVRQISLANRYRQFVAGTIAPITEFVAVVGLLTLAAVLVLIGRPTESIFVTLSLFVVGLVRLREVTSTAIARYTNLRYNLVSINPVYGHLKAFAPSVQRQDDNEGSAQRLRNKIELHDVSYRYDGASKFSLKNISLEIPAGSAVGFVGSTGAGKSTLIDIILGLLGPNRGTVSVDGKQITEDNCASWQKTVGYVPQSIYLLDDTVRRNIAFGVEDDEINDEAVADAARLAQLETFLAEQPHGLDTIIGEQGVRLSGGERQRIGIARALYHQPSVLIFDEATAALDNTTERAIVEAIEQIRGARTIIMVAHRLSTVRRCDTLYFLKDGCIEAEGDYRELQERHEDFRLMASA